jgi:hypothetical protein
VVTSAAVISSPASPASPSDSGTPTPATIAWALYPTTNPPPRAFCSVASGSVTFARSCPSATVTRASAWATRSCNVCNRDNSAGRVGGGGSSPPTFWASNSAIAVAVRASSALSSSASRVRSRAALPATRVPSTACTARSTSPASTATRTVRFSSVRIARRCAW